MSQRIPHSENAVMEGEQTAEYYLEHQKKLGSFYLDSFIRTLQMQMIIGRYLEIGPGPGYQTVEIAKAIPGTEIVALEPSQAMVKVAKDYCEQQGLAERITLVNGEVEDTELFQDIGKFDVIFSTFSLHHWLDAEKAFKNLVSAVKENGLILVYDFERHWLTRSIPIRNGMFDSIKAAYTPAEIDAILKKLGVQNYSIKRKFPAQLISIRPSLRN